MRYLYLYRVRARSPEAVAGICQVFEHSLSLFQEPGWMGGDCMANRSDPLDILIYERWASDASLRGWLSSEARRQAHRDLAPFVVGPPREEMFEEV